MLVHDAFVRGLARQLVRDPEQAADVAQQTWLSALRRPPAGTELPTVRAFLAAIVRRLVGRARRGAARTLAREQAVAREPLVPSPAEIVAREVQRRAVVDAVLALDPIYRDVVVLRFFEHLPPRRIAARLQLPVETVRTRLKRALTMLRTRLDGAAGGRGAWVALLWPFAGQPALPIAIAAADSTFVLGVLTMSMQKLAWLAVAVLLLAIPWFGWVSPWLGESAAPPAGEAAVLVAGGVEAAPAAAMTPTSDEPVSPTPLRREAAASATTGALVVRVLFAEGGPVTDAVVDLHRSGTSDLDAPRARTDADGRVRFEGLAIGKLTPTVHRGDRQWGKAVTVVAGAEVQSEVQLEPGMNVRGIVVDGRQQPIGGAEIVVSGWAGGEAVPLTRTEADGTFALRGVYTHCHIGARAAGFAASPLRQFTAGKGADVELRVVLDSPAIVVTGSVLDPHGQPVVGALVRAGDEDQRPTVLPDGGRAHGWRPEYARTDANGQFVLRHLPAGPVPLAVRALPYAPWLGEVALTAGQPHATTIRLLPGATVHGTVRGADGSSVAGATITFGVQHEFVQQEVSSDASGAFRVEGLPAGELLVTAQAQTHGKARTRLALTAGRDLTWDPLLAAGQQQRGRVVDADDQPVVQAMVQAQGQGAIDGDWFFAHESTDEQGRFTLKDVPNGLPLQLQVVRQSSFPELVHTLPQRTDEEVLLRLPKATRVHIRGTVLDPDGKPLPNVAVSPFLLGGNGSPAETADPATGAFALGPYPAGEYTLNLAAADLVPLQLRRTLVGDETWEVGEVRLQRGAYVVLAPVVDNAELLAGTRFEAAADDGGPRQTFESRDGRWRAGPLRAGSYRLFAIGEAIAPQSLPFELRAGSELVVDVPLQRGIRATLVATADRPLPAGTLMTFLVRDAHGVLLDMPAAACDGTQAQVRFGLAPGRYTIEAGTKGWRGSVVHDVVAGDAAPVVRIELKPE